MDPNDEQMLGLKKSINNFLWTNLPSSITIGEAEDIALHWYNQIVAVYRKHQPAQSDRSSR